LGWDTARKLAGNRLARNFAANRARPRTASQNPPRPRSRPRNRKNKFEDEDEDENEDEAENACVSVSLEGFGDFTLKHQKTVAKASFSASHLATA
jgi:hypothetical protein